MTCYKLSEQQANPIYDQTMNLFHEFSTIIELSSLLTMDKKLLSSLVVFIMEIIDLENPNKYRYSLFYNKLNSFFIDCMEELLMMMMILRPTRHFFFFC